MKLSDLVRLLNNIDQQPQPDAASICQRELGELVRTIREGNPSLPSHIADLERDYHDVHQMISRFCDHVWQTRQEIQSMIEAMQTNYFAQSYRLHDDMAHDTDQYIFERQPALSPQAQQYLEARIAMHSDWHHPALVIRPGKGEWLSSMVGSDPLYLADIRSSLLTPSIQQFNPEYQRRVRCYVLRETDREGHVLGDLPDNQFGFCVAVNFFHYKPFEIMRTYLTDIYRRLKPGGVLAFTFNDCDHWGGVELAERSFMCYTPGGMVRSLCSSLGFEITQQYVIDHSNTWLEMRRPGQLTSLRGGQALAKIVANQ